MFIVTRKNRIVCAECGNADSSRPTFLASTKIDDRLSKDNLKFYEVKWVYGGGAEFSYDKISLKVGDVVITEALGDDFSYQNQKYKIFDVDHIVAKLERK